VADPGLVEVQEGPTRLLVPPRHTTHGPAPRAAAAGTFYNRAAARNRDVSVLYMAARHQGSDVRAVDVLAGTGARSVRWVVEAGLTQVTINDRSPSAAQAIQANLERNAAQAEVVQQDALVLLAERSFQHVELDPYGSPAPFLDAAFRNLGRRGGVSFTATDAAALCGAQPQACLRRYGARPTRTEELCHEGALRILLASAIRAAAVHDQAAVPVLANSREHYFRCYVETRRAAKQADALLAQLQWLVECRACLHRGFSPERLRACPACGAKAEASGPMWSGPLGDPALLQAMEAQRQGRVLADARAVERDLALWAQEAQAGGLPFDTHAIAEREGIPEGAPADGVVEALQAQGHGAARTHLAGMYVRTPAPAKEVVEAVRVAARTHAAARGGRPPQAGS
jgi:tRNA (guanine26-N2/guanine27-N2)-dimethyltransferase